MPTAAPIIEMDPIDEEPQDFSDVVRRYTGGVLALALNLTGNRHDAEDLTQEVFIKVHRSLDSFRGDSGLYAWLRRVTVNTHLNRNRRKSVSQLRLLDDVDGLADMHRSEDLPSTDLETRQSMELIERALAGLSPRERSAFVMRHYHDLSTAEAAEAMQVAPGTVKSLLFRATVKLRDSLGYMRNDP